MNLEGFIPYKPGDVERYEGRRWWLGLTLGAMFDKATDLYPAKEALVGQDKRYTYAQVRRLVDRMAYRFHKAGLRRGDTVLLQLPNWPEFLYCIFCTAKSRVRCGVAHSEPHGQRDFAPGILDATHGVGSARTI